MSTPNWTPESITAHVGAPNFHEAIDVLLRTKASDEDTIAAQFNKLKEQSAALAASRAECEEGKRERDEARQVTESLLESHQIASAAHLETTAECEELKKKLSECRMALVAQKMRFENLLRIPCRAVDMAKEGLHDLTYIISTLESSAKEAE